MASYGRRKTTMMAMRGLLVLWLCGGLCLCMDEVTNVDDPAEPKDQGDTPTDGSLQADGSNTENEEEAPVDTSNIGTPAGDYSQWGDPAETEAPEVDTSDDDRTEAAEDQKEAVDDQSEAPQDEAISSTETPAAETESATSVSSQKPTPEPSEQADMRGDFMVRNDDGTICLRACFEASFTVDYIGRDENNKVVNRSTEIQVPKKADVGGRCGQGQDQSVLILQWDEGRYTLKITFQKKNATKKGDPNFWEALMIKFTFDTEDYSYFDSAIDAGVRVVHTDRSSTFFATPMGNSRVCDSEDDITMTSATNTTERVTMEISELEMQPFGMVNGTFSEGADCEEDLIENPSTNVASIAVGATLACLILVVIIVYAVGRKMGAINDRSGYKSVE